MSKSKKQVKRQLEFVSQDEVVKQTKIEPRDEVTQDVPSVCICYKILTFLAMKT